MENSLIKWSKDSGSLTVLKPGFHLHLLPDNDYEWKDLDEMFDWMFQRYSKQRWLKNGEKMEIKL